MAKSAADKEDKRNDKLAKRKCFTHEFRVSYPVLYKAEAYESNDPEFGVTMLFEKDVDLNAPANGTKTSLKSVVVQALEEKWGDKEDWPKNRRSPFRDGSDKSDEPGYKDCIFVKARAKESSPPQVFDERGKPLKDPTAIYAGCYARALVLSYPYDKSGNKGVGFTLLGIQKTRDGERLESGGDYSSYFTPVAGADVDDDVDTDSDDDSEDYDV